MILRKQKRSNAQAVHSTEFAEGAGPGEWTARMEELSLQLVDVRWKRHNIIVSRSKKIHNSMNDIREKIEDMPSDTISLIPSARWLIDNFQMIYREIKKLNFSTAGYAPIPILTSPPWRGLPRVYAISRTMVELTAGYLNEENIMMMLNAYQQVSPLTDRELQVLPEMAGLALLEHILMVVQEITRVVDSKTRAERFLKDNFEPQGEYPDVSPLLNQGEQGIADIHFHSHVLYQLRSMSLDTDSLQRYIAYYFRDEWENPSHVDIFVEESRRESLLESAIRNPIASLRALDEINDEIVFEALSMTESILSQDPENVYPLMDSASRASFRNVVERLAIKYNMLETHIAHVCVTMAKEGHSELIHPHHVGTYLVGRGTGLLKAKLLTGRVPSQVKEPVNLKGAAYFMFAFSALALLYFLLNRILLQAGYLDTVWPFVALSLAALPILVGFAIKAASSLFTRGIPAKNLPAMDYTPGVPDEARAMVVMPVIIANKEQGLEYLNRLHKHYLANRQNNLYFALLADYSDAQEQQTPGDEEIRQALIARTAQLNRKYPGERIKFSLFIRERRWNASQRRYMCWERKRGKLEEFNKLLNGVPIEDTTFSEMVSEESLIGSIKYIITLDADSDLVLDNASKLVGIIDHPLNRAVVDPQKKRIVEGYAIVQPQVMNHINDIGNSRFQRVYSGKTGVPNYSMAISDIYQDVFKSGIFVGKGIYNVRVFHQLLSDVIPENRVLSHDLLESCYLKTAFAGDAHIVESFPGSFAAYAKRLHRWIRGDWQLLPWLFKPDLNILSKWKILDDLRSSLVPVGKLALILLNLALFPRLYWLWLAILLLPLALDLLGIAVDMIVHWTQGRRYVLLYRKLLRELSILFFQVYYDLVFIPFEAYYSLDAIIRTLYRYTISKRNFLLWDSAEQVEKTAENTLSTYFRHMWPSIIASAGVVLLLSATSISLLGMGLYVCVAVVWALSFYIAHSISRNDSERAPSRVLDDNGLLRETARRTWRFFRDMSTPDNHMLCPDNYQLGRRERLTHKTSPTNIGLQFLSALSAWDMGFETQGYILEYLEDLLATVAKLNKWQGHLYNWYDTHTLQTLSPQYISTVDSGNFMGYLVALRSGLADMPDVPIMSPASLEEVRALLSQLNADMTLRDDYATFGDMLDDLSMLHDRIAMHAPQTGSRDMLDVLHLAHGLQSDISRFGMAELPYTPNLSLADLAQAGHAESAATIERIEGMLSVIDGLLAGASFASLYNTRRKLFYIGFNVSSQTYDNSCYDLIASESLLTSLLAIAKGDVPARHWQRLGRPLTIIKGRPAHVSWSGTMFEYLMPRLVMREYHGSVFEDSSNAAVLQQMAYAQHFNIPWGMSESQYYRFDTNQNYQYKAFGVPKLRLQPVYKDLQIVSPYSTMLALEYGPARALDNLKRLMEMGSWGEYGFYEAIDFTVPDPVTLKDYCVVKSFMAHHQGMSLVAINNYFNRAIMRRRFHATPMIKAAEALLEEKHQSLFASPSRRGYSINFKRREIPQDDSTNIRTIKSTNLVVSPVNYMSNGSYSLLVTSDGDGFSRRGRTMLYRWRPDIYAETGAYIYIRDTQLGTYWSSALNPTKAKADKYQVVFSPHQAEYLRQDKGITTTTVVSLVPSYNMEVRQVTLKNISARPRELEVTSYLEVALDTYAAESSHPAFNKLFIESEIVREQQLFISKRRGGMEEGPLAMHMLRTNAELEGDVTYESSRASFIGRNRTLKNPQALQEGASLSDQAAFSGDPIMSIRARLVLDPGAEKTVLFISGIFDTKEALLQASEEFSMAYRSQDAMERFRQQSRIELKYMDMTGSQYKAFQNIIRQVFYPHKYYRGPADSIRRNWSGQSGLWRFGISGDNPILLLVVRNAAEVALVRDVLKIYEYMGINMVRADLVILAEGSYGYISELTNMITGMTSALRIYDSATEKPGIYIVHSYELSPSDTDLLYTVASVVFTGDTGIHFRRSATRQDTLA